MFGYDRDQFGVCLAIDGGGVDVRDPRPVGQFFELCDFSIRLDFDLNNHSIQFMRSDVAWLFHFKGVPATFTPLVVKTCISWAR